MKESEILNRVLDKENERMSVIDMYDWISVRISSILHNMKLLLSGMEDNEENEHFLYHYTEAYNHLKYADAVLSSLYHDAKLSRIGVNPIDNRELRDNPKMLIDIKQKIYDIVSHKASKWPMSDKMTGSFLTNLDKFEEEIYNAI